MRGAGAGKGACWGGGARRGERTDLGRSATRRTSAMTSLCSMTMCLRSGSCGAGGKSSSQKMQRSEGAASRAALGPAPSGSDSGSRMQSRTSGGRGRGRGAPVRPAAPPQTPRHRRGEAANCSRCPRGCCVTGDTGPRRQSRGPWRGLRPGAGWLAGERTHGAQGRQPSPSCPVHPHLSSCGLPVLCPRELRTGSTRRS